LILAALLLSWQQQLVGETRHWEKVMGLPRHAVRFADNIGTEGGSPICGVALREGVAYSLNLECQRVWVPRNLALHEMCHFRMLHLDTYLTREEQEQEAVACARVYLTREKEEVRR
jgi:hypothetical protein